MLNQEILHEFFIEVTKIMVIIWVKDNVKQVKESWNQKIGIIKVMCGQLLRINQLNMACYPKVMILLKILTLIHKISSNYKDLGFLQIIIIN